MTYIEIEGEEGRSLGTYGPMTEMEAVMLIDIGAGTLVRVGIAKFGTVAEAYEIINNSNPFRDK